MRPWVSDDNASLFVDLYEMTMMQAYLAEGMRATAVFDLFVRRLRKRNYLVAAGLEDVLSFLETFRFGQDALSHLRSLGLFSDDFLHHLRIFRFQGDVYAVPEGTVVFGDEPMLEIVAPIDQGQFLETFALNQFHVQSLAASKASRVVSAARGRTVVDFGARRMHGTDAAMKSARAFWIAGVHATSNVLAGQVYGIPVSGTMAHSYIESHDSEIAAFRAFARTFPETILLVDTYGTLDGVRNVVRLARELGDDFTVHGIRLDSGDLAALARESRAILDAAGLRRVEIFASSSLDEYAIDRLLSGGAPIDGFGVGTHMGVSEDAPYLDSVYKLVEYEGRGCMKLSREKKTLPGRKQVFRVLEAGEAVRDVIGLHDEETEGRPLMELVMRDGVRTEAGKRTLKDARENARRSLAELPVRLRSLHEADPPYCVRISTGLSKVGADLAAQIRSGDRIGFHEKH